MLGPIVLKLDSKEKELGLSYVAFSQATRLCNMGIADGPSLDWLQGAICTGATAEARPTRGKTQCQGATYTCMLEQINEAGGTSLIKQHGGSMNRIGKCVSMENK